MITHSTGIKSALRSRQGGFLLNPYRFTPPAPASTTALLLHFTGALDSTVFTDSSPYARTITKAGAVVIRTELAKFGTSGRFATGVLSAPLDDSLRCTGDFTAECFLAPPSTLETTRTIFGVWDNSSGARSWRLVIPAGLRTTLLLESSVDGEVNAARNLSTADSSFSVSATFSHMAITRAGDIFRIFINGVLKASATMSGALYQPVSGSFTLGATNSGTDALVGLTYMDEFRLTKGAALYTANFTPPTAPFPDA